MIRMFGMIRMIGMFNGIGGRRSLLPRDQIDGHPAGNAGLIGECEFPRRAMAGEGTQLDRDRPRCSPRGSGRESIGHRAGGDERFDRSPQPTIGIDNSLHGRRLPTDRQLHDLQTR